jgi:cyclophilin family peptidyl-prolyl cis-trans isomerase
MATSKRERQKAARRIKIEQMQRQAKRRQNIRRGIIFGIVAVLVLGAGTLLFSSKTTPTTLATTTTAPSNTTTTAAAATPTTIPKARAAALQTKANAAAVAAGCPASPTTRVNNLTFPKAPVVTIDKTKTYEAHFVTTAGDFVVKLDAATAPITTNNFVFLAQHDFYKCVIFHRVIPGFVIQGGDPSGTGTSGPGYTIPDELPATGNPTYPLYSVAMANESKPHTGGSQFFIVTGTSGESLPAQYSLFGQVISGQSVVKAINDQGNTGPASNPGVPPVVTNRMLSVTITQS